MSLFNVWCDAGVQVSVSAAYFQFDFKFDMPQVKFIDNSNHCVAYVNLEHIQCIRVIKYNADKSYFDDLYVRRKLA